ncbi:MAG: hypothetical protein ABL864_14030 [Terricaulis sp.]
MTEQINIVERPSAQSIDIIERPSTTTIAITMPPSGAMGPTGYSSAIFTAEAEEALSGHRCVAWTATGTVEYADNATAGHAWATVGITTGAASAGASATVQASGEMIEGSWSWIPLGLIYLGTGGLLTQTAPAGPAFLRVLGHAIDATSMWIDPQQPIIQT